MEISLTTPSILFPAVSLLMLVSLIYYIREIRLSGLALEIEIEDMEAPRKTTGE